MEPVPARGDEGGARRGRNDPGQVASALNSIDRPVRFRPSNRRPSTDDQETQSTSIVPDLPGIIHWKPYVKLSRATDRTPWRLLSDSRHVCSHRNRLLPAPVFPYRRIYLSRVVFALFIISKSGGLIYNREFHAGLQKLNSNDLLMLAGSFHGYVLCPCALPNPGLGLKKRSACML